jgi:glycine betaine/proline transport system permease protein
MIQFPDFLVYRISGIIDTGVNWVLTNFRSFFRGFASFINTLFQIFDAIFSNIPWWVYVIILVVVGWKLYKLQVGLVLGGMLFAIGMFGLWDDMIYTVVIIFMSVTASLILGIPTGILMAKSARVEKILKPILDGMQTMPSFVYLIPAVMLFGLGRVPAVIATAIYALPPLIRLTYLGITNVDEEVVEAGKAFGSTGFQLLTKIELPQSLSTIMTGVNQTTMMAMAMVVIASMIGADGIGSEVLISIRRLEVGRGVQAGLAIVFLAIILDRVFQGIAKRFERSSEASG